MDWQSWRFILTTGLVAFMCLSVYQYWNGSNSARDVCDFATTDLTTNNGAFLKQFLEGGDIELLRQSAIHFKRSEEILSVCERMIQTTFSAPTRQETVSMRLEYVRNLVASLEQCDALFDKNLSSLTAGSIREALLLDAELSHSINDNSYSNLAKACRLAAEA